MNADAHSLSAGGRGFLDRAAQAALGLAALALLLMVLIQAWQVYARYVLNDSPGWTEPLALLCMNTVMMCGSAVGVRHGRHFAFTLLVDAVRPRIAAALRAVQTGLIAAVGAGLACGGAVLLRDDWSVRMAGADLPEGLRYLPLCIGGVLIVLFAFERWLPATSAREN